MNTRKEAEKQDEQNNAKDIPLKIISIPDKEWKDYRNQATQDELFVLGLGMKLWLAKTRKSTLFFALALLLSVAVGIVVTILTQGFVGVIILVLGYLIFCTLCVRRHFIQQSFSQTKQKLTAENKKALDTALKTSGGAKFADVIITLILCTVCEPYFLVLAVLSAIIPSLMNTKLVIPEGYGFEQLEEVKGYYAEKSFLSQVIDMTGEETGVAAFKRGFNGTSMVDDGYDEYTFTNDMGCSQTAYSKNGVDFYDANGAYIGKSSDHGKYIKVDDNK